MQNMPQLKLGNIRVVFNNFQNCACCEKYLKDNKHNSLNLARKHARIFTLGHHLFLRAHSFLGSRSRKTVHFPEQIVSAYKYLNIFSPQIEALCFYNITNGTKIEKLHQKNKISLGKRC